MGAVIDSLIRSFVSRASFVIPSNARDLGFCLKRLCRLRTQEPGSLALLGMTRLYVIREDVPRTYFSKYSFTNMTVA
jgi:hypothetical protein